jgi:hypothetical protein
MIDPLTGYGLQGGRDAHPKAQNGLQDGLSLSHRGDAVLNVRGVSEFVLELRTGGDKVSAGGFHSIGTVRVFPLFAQVWVKGVAVVLNVKHD